MKGRGGGEPLHQRNLRATDGMWGDIVDLAAIAGVGVGAYLRDHVIGPHVARHRTALNRWRAANPDKAWIPAER